MTRGSNRDAFQGKCDCCLYKTSSGIVLSDEGCSERLGKASHWQNTQPACLSAHGDYAGCTVLFSWPITDEHKTERKAVSSKLKPKDIPCPRMLQKMKPGSTILKLYAFDGICPQRRQNRSKNGSRIRYESGHFRVTRVRYWHYTRLLDNSCWFVRVLTLTSRIT
jgi:hypothetical protein